MICISGQPRIIYVGNFWNEAYLLVLSGDPKLKRSPFFPKFVSFSNRVKTWTDRRNTKIVQEWQFIIFKDVIAEFWKRKKKLWKGKQTMKIVKTIDLSQHTLQFCCTIYTATNSTVIPEMKNKNRKKLV